MSQRGNSLCSMVHACRHQTHQHELLTVPIHAQWYSRHFYSGMRACANSTAADVDRVASRHALKVQRAASPSSGLHTRSAGHAWQERQASSTAQHVTWTGHHPPTFMLLCGVRHLERHHLAACRPLPGCCAIRHSRPQHQLATPAANQSFPHHPAAAAFFLPPLNPLCSARRSPL